jgi:pyruvate/2-oxoglutarate dehydrogenase complex dihydrolipoamide acyltransferase (E2) component
MRTTLVPRDAQLESPASGVLVTQVVAAGGVVAVGAVVASIEER